MELTLFKNKCDRVKKGEKNEKNYYIMAINLITFNNVSNNSFCIT